MKDWVAAYINKEPKYLESPDGTIIEIYEDKNIIVTPNGYRVQINIYPPEFIMLSQVQRGDGYEPKQM